MSSLGAQGPSADASAASALASMPSDAMLQEPSADDEPFAQDTCFGFDSSAYLEVLDRGLAGIRKPVVPHPERPAQLEAPRKKPLAEPVTEQQHQHSKLKRARHSSPTKAKAPAASPAKSLETNTRTPTRRLLLVVEVFAPSSQCRKAAEQADASRRAARENALRLTEATIRVRPNDLGPASLHAQLPQLQ